MGVWEIFSTFFPCSLKMILFTFPYLYKQIVQSLIESLGKMPEVSVIMLYFLYTTLVPCGFRVQPLMQIWSDLRCFHTGTVKAIINWSDSTCMWFYSHSPCLISWNSENTSFFSPPTTAWNNITSSILCFALNTEEVLAPAALIILCVIIWITNKYKIKKCHLSGL